MAIETVSVELESPEKLNELGQHVGSLEVAVGGLGDAITRLSEAMDRMEARLAPAV